MDSSDIGKHIDSEESPAQKQARIRRERREAKIKAGGSARLDKITSLTGRPLAEPAPFQTPPPPTAAADDPDEVDISTHPYAKSNASSSSPCANNVVANEAELRRLLRSDFPVPDDIMLFGTGGFPLPQQERQEMHNPIRMFQQLMEDAAGAEGAQAAPGLPPRLAAMLGGVPSRTTGAGGMAQEQTPTNSYLWEIIHAVFALALGIYITSMTTFSGAKFSRTNIRPNGEVESVQFFWAFATAELVLQSSRFFLEKGQVSQTGWVGFMIGFLPEPWKGWLALASRYSGIYTTVVQDAMAVIFVLGSVAWWRTEE